MGCGVGTSIWHWPLQRVRRRMASALRGTRRHSSLGSTVKNKRKSEAIYPCLWLTQQAVLYNQRILPGKECQKFTAPVPAHWMPAYKRKKDKTLRKIRNHLENKSLGNLLNFNWQRNTATFSTIFPVSFLCPSQATLLKGCLSPWLLVGRNS